MRVIVVAGLLAAGLSLAAQSPVQSPKGFEHWTPAQLHRVERTKLQPHLDPRQRMAAVNLVNFGGHWTMLAHREATGGAEMHAASSDIFVIESGAATLAVGGRIKNAKQVSPGETRGSAVVGGRRVTLHPGDIVNIPPNTPHQMLLARGQKITYFVIKVKD